MHVLFLLGCLRRYIMGIGSINQIYKLFKPLNKFTFLNFYILKRISNTNKLWINIQNILVPFNMKILNFINFNYRFGFLHIKNCLMKIWKSDNILILNVEIHIKVNIGQRTEICFSNYHSSSVVNIFNNTFCCPVNTQPTQSDES